MKEFHKGLGSSIVEKQVLTEFFHVKGDYGQVLKGVTEILIDDASLYTMDGEELSFEQYGDERMHLQEGLKELRDKYNHIRGISKRGTDPHGWIQKVAPYFPDIAKLAFGTNLTAATIIVEGGLNWRDQVLNPLNVDGAIKSIMGPLYALSPSVREAIGVDLLHITDALTQSYVTDFEAVSVNKSWKKKTAEWTGRKSVALAHLALRGITYSRAITLRRWLYSTTTDTINVSRKDAIEFGYGEDSGGTLIRQVSKLKYLSDLVNRERIKAEAAGGDPGKIHEDDVRLITRLGRKAGLGKGNSEIVRYLLRSGLLDPDKAAMFHEMIAGAEEGGLNEHKGSYYRIDEMRQNLEKASALAQKGDPLYSEPTESAADNENYRDSLYILQSMRHLERLYIEDVILNPNAFDMYTRGDVLGGILEVYMRYPTIFAANAVLRRGGRHGFTRTFTSLLAASLLDILYMNIIALGHDEGWERQMDRWEDHPYITPLTYVSRLPMFGRWMSNIVEAAHQIVGGGFSGRDPGGTVGVGATIAMLQGLTDAGKDTWDGDFKGSLLDLWRFLPVFGDVVLRIGYYNFLQQHEDDYQKRPADTGVPHQYDTGSKKTSMLRGDDWHELGYHGRKESMQAYLDTLSDDPDQQQEYATALMRSVQEYSDTPEGDRDMLGDLLFEIGDMSEIMMRTAMPNHMRPQGTAKQQAPAPQTPVASDQLGKTSAPIPERLTTKGPSLSSTKLAEGLIAMQKKV
jgi:hypothetical protein